MTQPTRHSYEELRAVVVDILLGREQVKYPATQYRHLVAGVAEVLARREGRGQNAWPEPRLSSEDTELVRDIFWDLFRQGFIILGLNDSNEAWPFFRLSRFGQQTLGTQSPFRFHDTTSFITMVKHEVPDISAEAVIYLDEAVACFFADCLLACCVMVGVAAEVEFLRLVDVAVNGVHGSAFAAVLNETFVRPKITKFQQSLKQFVDAKKLPREAIEDLDTNFAMIQSVLRGCAERCWACDGSEAPAGAGIRLSAALCSFRSSAHEASCSTEVASVPFPTSVRMVSSALSENRTASLFCFPETERSDSSYFQGRLECGHSHTEFLGGNPGKQRRCQSCILSLTAHGCVSTAVLRTPARVWGGWV